MEFLQSIAQYVGYLASVFLVASFLFKDIKLIRFVNMLACICFVFYGFFTGTDPHWPIIIPNAILTGIQIYYLSIGK